MGKHAEEVLDFDLYLDPITEEWRVVESLCICADPENCVVPVKGCRKLRFSQKAAL